MSDGAPRVMSPACVTTNVPVRQGLADWQVADLDPVQFHGGTLAGSAQHLLEIVAANLSSWWGGA